MDVNTLPCQATPLPAIAGRFATASRAPDNAAIHTRSSIDSLIDAAAIMPQ